MIEVERKLENKDPYKGLKDIHKEMGVDFEVIPSQQYTYEKFRTDFVEDFLKEDVLWIISNFITFVNQPMLKDSFKKSEDRSAFAATLEPTLKKQHGENKLKVNKHFLLFKNAQLLLSFINEKPEDLSLDRTRKLCAELIKVVVDASPEVTNTKVYESFSSWEEIKDIYEKKGWKSTLKIGVETLIVRALARANQRNKRYFNMPVRRKVAYVRKLDALCRKILKSLEVTEEIKEQEPQTRLGSSFSEMLRIKIAGWLGVRR